jgi:hypothetical protein
MARPRRKTKAGRYGELGAGLGGFICFVPVTDEDSYPVYLSDQPLNGADGTPICTRINHQTRTIKLSPLVPVLRWADEIDNAAQYARQTYSAATGGEVANG